MRAPIAKIALGFLYLFIIMGGSLFGPASTFNYPQAWIYLFVFNLSCALITAYIWKKNPPLFERRMRGRIRDEKEKKQRLIRLFMMIAFLGLLIVPAIDHRLGWSSVPLLVEIAGCTLSALGFYLFFVVLKTNSFASSTVEKSPDQRVISTGPYAIVRHPMYSGALVLFLGTPLALGSWTGLLMVIPSTIGILLRLIAEEQFLEINLPGYREYRQKVRYRLIPRLW